MEKIYMTAYILMWPMLVSVVLYLLVSAFFREWRTAREKGRPLV